MLIILFKNYRPVIPGVVNQAPGHVSTFLHFFLDLELSQSQVLFSYWGIQSEVDCCVFSLWGCIPMQLPSQTQKEVYSLWWWSKNCSECTRTKTVSTDKSIKVSTGDKRRWQLWFKNINSCTGKCIPLFSSILTPMKSTPKWKIFTLSDGTRQCNWMHKVADVDCSASHYLSSLLPS